MARIVIDARQYTTSTGRYTFRLIQYLEALDNEHDYYILLKPADMEVSTFTNPRFHKVECPHKEFTFNEQLGLLRQVKSLNPDLVHFAIVQQPILYRGKVVTTIHDLTTTRFVNPDKKRTVFILKQTVLRYVIRSVTRTSRAIITPSQFVKDDLVAETSIVPEKVHVTYEGADFISAPPTPLPNLLNKDYIMYVGRPTPHKNLERLIEAFLILHETRPSLMLVLAGKKDSNYTRIEAGIPAEIRDNVFFTDFVSEGQLRWLYEHCAAYVFPSLSEGFGLPGLEAMVHGAPVISSNATCLPEVYGSAAYYFDPNDTGAMAKAIETVLADPVLRAQLIKDGKTQAAKYSWKKMAEQTLALYDTVLPER